MKYIKDQEQVVYMNKTLKINIYGLIGTLIYLTTFFNPTTFNYNNLKYLLIVIIGYLLLKKCKKVIDIIV